MRNSNFVKTVLHLFCNLASGHACYEFKSQKTFSKGEPLTDGALRKPFVVTTPCDILNDLDTSR